jgi:hypothetical protein
MSRREDLLNSPPGAELRLARIYRRVYRHATTIIAAEIRRQWPEFSPIDAAAALHLPDIDDELHTVGDLVVTHWLAGLREITGQAPPADAAAEVLSQWLAEVSESLTASPPHRRDAVIVTDSVLAAGLWSLVRMAGSAVRTAAVAGRTVDQAIDRFRQRAAPRVRSATNRAAHAAYSLGSSVNNRTQRAMGLTHYRWRTRRDAVVRPMHRALDDTIQSWADPPVISPDGRRFLYWRDARWHAIDLATATSRVLGPGAPSFVNRSASAPSSFPAAVSAHDIDNLIDTHGVRPVAMSARAVSMILAAWSRRQNVRRTPTGRRAAPPANRGSRDPTARGGAAWSRRCVSARWPSATCRP